LPVGVQLDDDAVVVDDVVGGVEVGHHQIPREVTFVETFPSHQTVTTNQTMKLLEIVRTNAITVMGATGHG
jgi:hypothetical protein